VRVESQSGFEVGDAVLAAAEILLPSARIRVASRNNSSGGRHAPDITAHTSLAPWRPMEIRA
jgi:hypothetical protein